jgi:hypothetical protein
MRKTAGAAVLVILNAPTPSIDTVPAMSIAS